MSSVRYAFVKANWHAEIVDRALMGFRQEIGEAAFVVDGGIYRHEFVASTVLEGLMRAQMDTNVPVLSVVLTPHSFQETPADVEFFRAHFVRKGQEAARAAKLIGDVRRAIAA